MLQRASVATVRADRQVGGAVELKQLTKRYGDETVVDAVSLAIQPGEFFSLLGPSGSGKSTTLMMVAGFTAVDSGQIVVDGVDVGTVPPQRRGFGFVFQNYAIFPHLNVYENIAFPLRARHCGKAEIAERVERALHLVRLERFADKFARQLSGGQQQRVAIARAVVFDPAVVLMDEPLGALDKNLRYQMQLEIKAIQQRLGMTVIYVTHDQGEAMTLSDRLAILDGGRIQQVGAPDQVYEQPANAFVGHFLGEANVVAGTIVHEADGSAVLQTADGVACWVEGQPEVTRGQTAKLFIRPEKLLLSVGLIDRGQDWVHVPGQVEQRTFLGNTIRYSVSVGPSTQLTVDATNNGRDALLDVGTQVHVGWSPENARLLEA